LLLALLLAWPRAAAAQPDPGEGQVQLPLEVYRELLEALEAATEQAGPAVGYAVGNANLNITVDRVDEGPQATISARLTVETLEDAWVAVPLLPSGAAVSQATVDGRALPLVATPQGLVWLVEGVGRHQVVLSYRADAERFEGGYSLAVPLPRVPSMQLRAELPGRGLDVAVIPATAIEVEETDAGGTVIVATVPSATGVQLSWRAPSEQAVTVSRAIYRGRAGEDAVTWEAELGVLLATDERVMLDLLGTDIALLGVQVDGADAPVTSTGGHFAVPIEGRGTHAVTARFEVPIERPAEAPPQVRMGVLAVPISRFELTLPGEKEVSVQPLAHVDHRFEEGTGETVAVVNVPMSTRVGFSWTEAVPEAAEALAELRANASIYHTAYAEEGVLYLHATVIFDVTRGETSQFELIVPADAVINDVRAPSGGVADWRQETDPDRRLIVFLDRRASGEFRFDVDYERLIGTDTDSAFSVPVLSALGVNRQRGMVALLASRELTLEPEVETSLTRVGENQLPAFVREAVAMTIAHTFRYFETTPELTARATPPERQTGRFDAQVDTLVSLGDVTTLGSASVDVNVKSGTIDALGLVLPPEVNVLSLSAPSLRDYELEPTEDGAQQRISVEFTQDMEGQFRVEVAYERIETEGAGEMSVPLLHVEGCEVEQGRVAVEALTAVEVQASATEQLSSVEVAELPRRLVLRTTNPILLAFKYVQADPPPSLVLRITKHREIDVQSAIIDRAHYRTLYTRDGFAVTTAEFFVRNSRQQFLRVRLPEGAVVWTATVNGRAETPAMASNGEGGPEVLINIINSANGFPVELIYATRSPAMAAFGFVEGELPRPDMVVTRTRWEVLLPDRYDYGDPLGDLDVAADFFPVRGDEMAVLTGTGLDDPTAQSLRISVPNSGVAVTFEKLYANQTDREIAFSIPYWDPDGALAAIFEQIYREDEDDGWLGAQVGVPPGRQGGSGSAGPGASTAALDAAESAAVEPAAVRIGFPMSLLGTLLFWAGVVGVVQRGRRSRVLLAAGLLGAVLLAVAFGRYQAPLDWPLRLSVLLLVALLGWLGRARLLRWLESRPSKAVTG
jgi:hypothetical protein